MPLGLKQREVQATVLSQVVFQRDWAEEELWVGGLKQVAGCQN